MYLRFTLTFLHSIILTLLTIVIVGSNSNWKVAAFNSNGIIISNHDDCINQILTIFNSSHIIHKKPSQPTTKPSPSNPSRPLHR